MNRIFIFVLLLNLIIGIYNLSLGLREFVVGSMNTSVGCMNLIVALLLFIPIVKNENRKKGLKQDLHIFEG